MMVSYFRFYAAQDCEEQFRTAWHNGTEVLRTLGSHGSALFTDADGAFHAIARWPDAATRDAAFSAPEAIQAFADFNQYSAAPSERIDLFEDTNLWAPYPPL